MALGTPLPTKDFHYYSTRLKGLLDHGEFVWVPEASESMKYHEGDVDIFNQSENPSKSSMKLLEERIDMVRNMMNERLGKDEQETIYDNTKSTLLAKKSGIPGAGFGLFTTVDIPSGSVVCFYTGCRHDFRSQQKLMDKSYLLSVGDFFFDPSPANCLNIMARYINDPINCSMHNVKYVEEKEIYSAGIVATRGIKAGEEIFISYGEAYWKRESQFYTPTCLTTNSVALDNKK
ncbi:hypothetical protein TrLO_g10269 [Triparma laevis f. longispina]|uniref:SET domain-containing protein n=1 Tax=Triparma laevis f. longispina TaxID=1714387 RepID=A0A9W7FPI8_9STRA|nr:hypothetical protein TrLO_g10269 [Triparma laevis f. longispina]